MLSGYEHVVDDEVVGRGTSDECHRSRAGERVVLDVFGRERGVESGRRTGFPLRWQRRRFFGAECNGENRRRHRRPQMYRRLRGDRKINHRDTRRDERCPVDTHEMPCVVTPFDHEMVFAHVPVVDDDVVVEGRSHCDPRRVTERVHTRFDAHAAAHRSSGCHRMSAFCMGERRARAATNTGRLPPRSALGLPPGVVRTLVVRRLDGQAISLQDKQTDGRSDGSISV